MSFSSTHVQTFIKVKFVKGGIHRFPRAVEPQFATGDEYDVSFLANDHFHYFHFTVWVSVDDLDREIEFIQFQRWCENLYKEGTIALDYKSCEMMCHDLYEAINAEYPGRIVKIEITEDDINGAYVEFHPTTDEPAIDGDRHMDLDDPDDEDDSEDDELAEGRPFGVLLEHLDDDGYDRPSCLVAAFVNCITGKVEPMRFTDQEELDRFCENQPAGTLELIDGTTLEIYLPKEGFNGSYIH